MAVKLAKGLWTRSCVDIIKTSIKIWPIRSLKSEYTAERRTTARQVESSGLSGGGKPSQKALGGEQEERTGVRHTIFRVLVELEGQRREKDDISILLLPRYAQDLTNELESLFF